jgi:pantetheine-phosphate adenylyltransferase
MSERIVAVYPGSFDPVTNGHLDILKRASKLFDRVVVAATESGRKAYSFDIGQRIEFLEDAANGVPNVEIDSFSGLLVEYSVRKGASVIVRGLREVGDFEYEYQMAVMNRKLAPEVETVFLSTGSEYYFVSSSLIKEVAALGGDVSCLVPAKVAEALMLKGAG